MKPITRILGKGVGIGNQSRGYKRMQLTKWHTLVGTSIAVISSTVLYINAILCFTIGGRFWSNPWLHIMVFGINLDSILNDIAMVFVSGVLKNLLLDAEVVADSNSGMQPVDSFVPNSQVSSVVPRSMVKIEHASSTGKSAHSSSSDKHPLSGKSANSNSSHSGKSTNSNSSDKCPHSGNYAHSSSSDQSSHSLPQTAESGLESSVAVSSVAQDC
jgi:hypothetical protein